MTAADPDIRTRLPLFPLPVVLLPGTQMPLHIFEQRYREMVRDVLEGDRRFGMVYHDWDLQGPFLTDEGTVGCLAEISQHESLDDGRSLIVIDGLSRFRIVDGIESDALYFEALVAPYTDASAGGGVENDGRVDPGQGASGAATEARRQASIDLFGAVLDTMSDRPRAIPVLSAGTDVSFVLAQTIRVDPRWHQELLEMTSEEERLVRIDTVLRALL